MKIEVENYDTPLDVFNLNVESYHTYLVGSEKLVVHNVCANDYKNKTYYFDEGTAQAKKYPNGIKVDSKGYPRFEEYAINTVKFDFPSQSGLTNGTCLSGEYLPDTKLANAICGYKSTPTGYVWHHVEDMQTMVLVPQDLHSFMKGGLRHNGGASLIRQLIKTFG